MLTKINERESNSIKFLKSGKQQRMLKNIMLIKEKLVVQKTIIKIFLSLQQLSGYYLFKQTQSLKKIMVQKNSISNAANARNMFLNIKNEFAVSSYSLRIVQPCMKKAMKITNIITCTMQRAVNISISFLFSCLSNSLFPCIT